jgi:hypothetical protein
MGSKIPDLLAELPTIDPMIDLQKRAKITDSLVD